MNPATIDFLRLAYRRYYYKHAQKIIVPEEIQEREFGFAEFDGKVRRHVSFKTNNELIAEVIKNTPASVYCSNARYENPSLPMDEKGWKGAELIFDIDADELRTKCKGEHDFWFCDKCGSYGKAQAPQSCTSCGGTVLKIEGRCETCMSAALTNTINLKEILMDDFGISESKISIDFSGNKGYHVYVRDSRFVELDQVARTEISLYVLGETLPSPRSVLYTLSKNQEKNSWIKRIKNLIQENKVPNTTLGVKKAVNMIAPKIDTQVTTDIHRIFRMSMTLHNHTGMLKMPVNDYDDFDPLTDPVVLDEESVKVEVRFYPKFTLKGQSFGPFLNEKSKLPTFAAAPILLSGLGEVCS